MFVFSVPAAERRGRFSDDLGVVRDIADNRARLRDLHSSPAPTRRSPAVCLFLCLTLTSGPPENERVRSRCKDEAAAAAALYLLTKNKAMQAAPLRHQVPDLYLVSKH